MFGMDIYKNLPTANGEYKLIRQILETVDSGNPIVFDVGGNIGEWTEFVIKFAKNKRLNIFSYIFEPASDSFQFLKIKFASENVRVYNQVISDSVGTRNFYVSGSLNGTNSLAPSINQKIVEVEGITIDSFVEINNINRIDFIKCDAEGFDFSVIKGSRNALQNKIIRAFQFEYNHRWIENRAYLRDVFLEANANGYVVCKISPKGLIRYDNWNGELERFFETNYVLLMQTDPILNKSLYVKNFDESNLPIYEYN